MKTLEPIYPELVEKIKAEYRLKIDTQPNEMLKKALQINCDNEVAKEIGRQRQEAIEQGGELGERIKAENEALKKELDAEWAKIDPEIIAEARKFQEEAERILNGSDSCPNCGATDGLGKFCAYCGTKLT